MKRLTITATLIATLIILVSYSAPVFSKGWEGNLVEVKKGALLCSYFAIDTALLLQRAGDQASIDVYVAKGKCVIAPKTFYAIVTKDITDIKPIMEITANGLSIWAPYASLSCCFKLKEQ